MGIPKKRSRCIVVEGKSFRWIPRQGHPWGSHLQVTIQEDVRAPGKPMLAYLLYKNWDAEGAEAGFTQRFSLIPREVAQIISEGLKAGWNPEERGAAFLLQGPLEFEHFRL